MLRARQRAVHEQVHSVLSAHSDDAKVHLVCRSFCGSFGGSFCSIWKHSVNLHVGRAAPRMQRGAGQRLHYRVAPPFCVQARACCGRGPAKLQLQPGGGVFLRSNPAGESCRVLILPWLL